MSFVRRERGAETRLPASLFPVRGRTDGEGTCGQPGGEEVGERPSGEEVGERTDGEGAAGAKVDGRRGARRIQKAWFIVGHAMTASCMIVQACRPTTPTDARSGNDDAGASGRASARASLSPETTDASTNPAASVDERVPTNAPIGSTDAPPEPPSESDTQPRSDASSPSEARAVIADASAPPARSTPSPTSAAGSTSPPEGMLPVPGGTFTMGTDAGGERDEHPAHVVTVVSFWLDRTEVTQAAYDACVRAGTCAAPDRTILTSYGGRFRGPNKPVVGISWFDAKTYCTWMGKRLPREAEFERAVRDDDGRRYPWGNEEPTHERTVFATEAIDDVGTHPAGRGPYGHDDLTGNVWEWIDDDYDPYAYTRPTAPLGKPGTCDEILSAQHELRARGMQGFTGTNPIPTECEKNIRGGAYNQPAHALRSTNRIHHPARFKLRMTGVRCAKDRDATAR